MRYKYIRVGMRSKRGYFEYYCKSEEKEFSPREAIDIMAEQGCRFVGTVPVNFDGYGCTAYDLVFEIEE